MSQETRPVREIADLATDQIARRIIYKLQRMNPVFSLAMTQA